jgi:opacity protein-like surface antigen
MSGHASPAIRLLAFVLLVGSATVHAQAPFADVAIGARHHSNLTRAHAPQDRRADVAVEASVIAGTYVALSGYDDATFVVDLRADRHDRFRGLDVVAIGASASYRRKLGLGLAAPYVAVSATIAREDYEVDVRDSRRLELRADVGRRLDERTDVAAGVAYDLRDGDTDVPLVPGFSSAIFDLRGATAYARAEFAPRAPWSLSLRASVRRGDVESTSQRGEQVFVASDAIAVDPAFNDPLLFGYRLRGTTWSLGAGVNYALGASSAIDVSLLREDTRAAHGLRYVAHIVSAAFVHRF